MKSRNDSISYFLKSNVFLILLSLVLCPAHILHILYSLKHVIMVRDKYQRAQDYHKDCCHKQLCYNHNSQNKYH